jgi:hypothetical protein
MLKLILMLPLLLEKRLQMNNKMHLIPPLPKQMLLKLLLMKQLTLLVLKKRLKKEVV